ncbi:aminotransferase [Aliikangiella coralliicola]|uniref:Aminotransferase n=1 Tax=Aliikangiella coralliicola TaxID=2592383 RepID=A0A545UD67_9GAMM|nr:aminotransferase [Aliikangiella coralliicola]TQV87414.1 aminotransferase [Aliikangiella coralliicola]
MKSYSPEQIWEMDKNHFIHPYTDFATFKDEGSQVVTGAKGTSITDSSGKSYLDGIAGLWCVNIGHGREEMANAIADQVMQMEYFNPFGHSTNTPGSILAAKLAELAPGDLNHVFYTCGGSTAIDSTIRLIHFYNNVRGKPDKKKIISRNDAYHGSTYVAANLTGIHATKYSFDRIANDWINHVSAANLYRRPLGAENLSEAEYTQFLVNEFENRIIQLGADSVAAFIAEPIMGAGGVLVAPEGYHKAMKAICEKYDILYIADEVVTGFGRLGHFFASKAIYDMQPDIIISAKGITSGYIPLGAAIISEKIYQVISKPQCEGGLFSMGFTYTGHPVACSAALKNIEIMERENICEHVQQVGAYFQEQICSLADLPIVGDCRGSHLMMGVEFVADKTNKTPFPMEAEISKRLFEHCAKLGLIVRPIGNIIVMSPPLTISREESDFATKTFRTSIEKTMDDLKRDGFL